jgi:hypothetical protein
VRLLFFWFKHHQHITYNSSNPSQKFQIISIINFQSQKPALQLDLGGESQQVPDQSRGWNTLQYTQGSSQDHWIATVITPGQNPNLHFKRYEHAFELFNSCKINEK